jgi:hypothetical protein
MIPIGRFDVPIHERHRGDLMRFLRVLLALGLVVSFARGGEILTESDKTIEGVEVVSVSAKDVVYKVNGKQITRKIGDVRKIDLRDVAKIGDKKYSQIDLTDGTTLLVSECSIKGKNLEMKLLSGPEVKVPIETVAAILKNAGEESHHTDWRNRVLNTRGKEAVVLKRNVKKRIGKGKEAKEVDDVDEKTGKVRQVIVNLLATIGEGDAKGVTIEIAVVIDEKQKPQKKVFSQKDLHGLIYTHALPPKSPGVICKLTDTFGTGVLASKIEKNKNGGVTVTTPSGASIDFTLAQIAQLDYSRGRFDYLSALQPNKTTITHSALDEIDKLEGGGGWFVYKDSSLNMTPIKLGGKKYGTGLTLLPDVALEYGLNGNYSRFDAVIGIDDEVRAEGEVTLEIWGDNKKLDTIAITCRTTKNDKGEPVPPTKPVKKTSLNVKNVETLKIVLKAKDELSGLSIHVSLGDAKVTR